LFSYFSSHSYLDYVDGDDWCTHLSIVLRFALRKPKKPKTTKKVHPDNAVVYSFDKTVSNRKTSEGGMKAHVVIYIPMVEKLVKFFAFFVSGGGGGCISIDNGYGSLIFGQQA
ncbi:hypothetical protein COOONC_27014, partial [Cooperia oncophora]